ncbi:MAG: hypothetical protein JXC32_16635 [Anaerolineae bacterium]|nr:hypothetical protein [Anaerolineae bacterium]
MQRMLTSQQVVADFFAQGYRVSGAFNISAQSLADVIYDQNTDYLSIQHAYLSPITEPAKISAHYQSTLLTKANLDFVLTLEQKDGLRRDQQYTLGNYAFGLCVSVPFFEIRGRLQTTIRVFDPRAYLSQEAGTFITLFDVTARCTFSPDISYHGGAALISRQSISFLGEYVSDET